MSVKVIALVTVNDDQPLALAAYLQATAPLLKAAGATILQRFALTDTVVGEKPSQSVLIVEYPSRQAVDDVFQSDTYKAIIPTRDRAFSAYSVAVVSGEDDRQDKVIRTQPSPTPR